MTVKPNSGAKWETHAEFVNGHIEGNCNLWEDRKYSVLVRFCYCGRNLEGKAIIEIK